MKRRNAVKQLLNVGLVSMLAAISSPSFAGAFQLFEYNGINAGDAGAGGAAIAEDASTGFINPAGLTRLKNKQLVLSSTFINARSTFEGTSVLTNTLGSYPASRSFNAARTNSSAVVPSFHFAAPLNQNLVFGFSTAAPFGLGLHYNENDFTRYVATNTSIEVLDLAPSLGLKVNDKFSVGAGLDIEKVTANLESIAGLPKYPDPTQAGTYFDSASKTEASDWGYGWHAGALYSFNPATRVGLSYRSQVVVHPSGTSSLEGRLAGGTTTGRYASHASTDVKLPPMTTLSVYHDVNPRLALMGTANYTQWSTIKELYLRNIQSVNASLGSKLINVTMPENFKNSWRFAVGANYKLTQKMLLRGGVAYDKSPIPALDRSLRLPDNDRTMVSIGSRYQVTKTVGLDLGYTHIFVKAAELNSSTRADTTTTLTSGISRAAADEVGAQITWNLG